MNLVYDSCPDAIPLPPFDMVAQGAPPVVADAVHQGVLIGDPNEHPYHPMPNPATGELKIDPEIELKAKKYNLAISFFYSSQSDVNNEYGRGRSATPRAYLNSSTSSTSVTIVRGNFLEIPLTKVGVSGGITTYTSFPNFGVITTLSYDGTEFTEYFNDGMKMVYKAQVGGGNPVKHELIRVEDASGVRQSYTYGSGAEAGLLKTIEVAGGRKVSFVYAASTGTSLLSSVEDWGNRRWTFQYDTDRRLTTLTTPLGCTTKYAYAKAGTGTVTMLNTIEDPRGYVTTYMYDSSRRVVSMMAGSALWTWTYGTGVQAQSVMTSPSGAVTTSLYSGASLSRIQRPEGYTSTYSYTNRQRTKEQVPAGTIYSVTYDQTLWLITASDDALGNRTTFLYDTYGNLTTLIDAEGNITSYAYAGTGSTHLRTRQTDPLGRITSYAYDSEGQLLSVTDPRGLITSFQYDTYGNLTTMIASDGGITTYGYDTLNRLTAVTDPLGRVTTYAYDAADNRTAVTNPASETTTYIYDQCLLSAVVNPLGYRTSYTYGRFQNRLTETDALGNVTSYQYDNQGFREAVIDALGNRSTILYNTARQKIADQDQLGNLTSYTYDSSGRRETVKDANGNVTTTVYNRLLA